ncbi:hypothetical protein EON65_28015 [archaeon]|nr:MAG: hypothetical protein EON65_28015 [archaeon]
MRCVCGPLSGFLVGVSTTIEYIFYITAAVSLLGDALSIVINIGGFLRPLYFLGFYVLTIGIQNGVGTRLSVYAYVLLGILTLLIILCYCIQTADKASIDNSNLTKRFDSPTHFMYAMHLGGWFYVGPDSLPLISSHVAEVRMED